MPEQTSKNPASVSIIKDGPFIFQGKIKVKPSFNAEVKEQANVSLCRCGLSKTKPFCDGSHMNSFRDEGIINKKPLAATRQVADQEIIIICVEDGPLMCRGNINITANDQQILTVIDPALCRCGHSKRKPFCDGSHNKIQFKTC